MQARFLLVAAFLASGALPSAGQQQAPPADQPTFNAGAEPSEIQTRLAAPDVQPGLRIDYTNCVIKATGAGRYHILLSLRADLPVRARPGDAADVVFVARNLRDGRVVASGTDTISLPPTARPDAPVGSSAWRVQFSVPAGSYLMRTVMREPGGLAGSADWRIDVRPPDGPEVAASDLVLGSVLSALPAKPLAVSGGELPGVIDAYARTPGQLANLEVRVELRKPGDDVPLKTTDAEIQPPQDDGAGSSRRARFVLALDGVEPGKYTAYAIVRATGETVAERIRQVEVLDPESAVGLAGYSVVERVTPIDVLAGDLGRRYVDWLRSRARGPEEEAARRATQQEWEQVELLVQRLPDRGALVARALRGLAFFAREDFRGAADALKDAFASEPRSSLTAFFLGWAYEGAGNPRDAIRAWRSAAQLDPTLVSAHIALADAFVRLSEPALALQAIRAGLAAIPDSPELRDRLARLQKTRNRP